MHDIDGKNTNTEELEQYLKHFSLKFEPYLEQALMQYSANSDRGPNSNKSHCPTRLYDAMCYAVLDGGKRLRPFLLTESARMFNVNEILAMKVAVSLEFIHCYSLVHDDLPAMDDDDLRRGRPTIHKAFDEATAILVGDSLLTAAFENLAESSTILESDICQQLVLLLAKAAGAHGMVGGQMRDLIAQDEPLDEDGIRIMQLMKTGALIRFSVEAGAVLGRANKEVRRAMNIYGDYIGYAYQIADDMLDLTSTTTQLGKAAGKDEIRGKATLVSLLGIEKSQQKLASLVETANKQLPFQNGIENKLKMTTSYIAWRNM